MNDGHEKMMYVQSHIYTRGPPLYRPSAADLRDGCANGDARGFWDLVRLEGACDAVVRKEEDPVVAHHSEHVLHAVVALQRGSRLACARDRSMRPLVATRLILSAL